MPRALTATHHDGGQIDTITRASPAYEPGPSVIANQRIDGSALRSRITRRLKRDRSPVTVLRGASALSLGKRICERVVPPVPSDTPVLLKPNIGGFSWFKNPARYGGDNGVTGRVTDPEFVRGVIRCLKARGVGAITVADGWAADHDDWQRLVKVSGYAAMSAEEQVALVAMNDDGVFDTVGDRPGAPLAVDGMEETSVPTLLMPKILVEHLDRGLVISLPKIKAHRFSVVSLAIKGLQGTVMYSDKAPAHRQKWRSHRELGPYLADRKAGKPEDRGVYVAALEAFSERMVDVLAVQAPHVVLAEGAPFMGGDGFHELFPGDVPVALGGTNPILVDRVGAELLGLWRHPVLARELHGHHTSPLIEAAAARFDIDLGQVDIVGDGASLVGAARPVRFTAMAPFSIATDPGGAALDPSTAPTPTAAATPTSPAAAPSSEQPRAYATALTGTAIIIDGRADDPAWQRAPTLAWNTDYAAQVTDITTRAKAVWSPQGLYLLFELENAGLASDRSRPTTEEHRELYKEDCVEIFLVPDPDRLTHYYEIEVGPYGHWFDLEIDRERERQPGKSRAASIRDLDWSSGLEVATQRDPAARTATIEVALTGPAITQVLRAGAILPLGLYRIEGTAPKRYLAWSPPRTPKPKFHVPQAFGQLVLSPATD
ncbi:MAG: hypothetical protein Tsb0020_52110 [Haliangiales bacterium]